MKDHHTSTSTNNKPAQLRLIAILMGITFMRAFMGTMIPSLEMYGGENPNAWFGPWVSDTFLGLLAPLMIFLLLTKRGIKTWGSLLVYNGIGAFDYAHGLITQWTDPLTPNGIFGTPELTYGSLSFSLVVQLAVIMLLFSPNVIDYFNNKKG